MHSRTEFQRGIKLCTAPTYLLTSERVFATIHLRFEVQSVFRFVNNNGWVRTVTDCRAVRPVMWFKMVEFNMVFWHWLEMGDVHTSMRIRHICWNKTYSRCRKFTSGWNLNMTGWCTMFEKGCLRLGCSNYFKLSGFKMAKFTSG